MGGQASARVALGLALWVIAVGPVSAPAQGAGIITTYAGTGGTGFSGDGGAATQSSLDHPLDVAIDPDDGAVHISDTNNNRIRRVDPQTGIITTVAGTGEEGFDREPLPAVDAHLRVPRGIAFDAQGNLYVADHLNNRIRRIDDATGDIQTIAGDGRKEPNGGGEGGPATAAPLHHPSDIAFDAAGNLYITDTYGHLVRKVDTSGIITTIAGVAEPTQAFSAQMLVSDDRYLSLPQSLALDGLGRVYVADTGHNRVVRVNPDKTLTPVAGNGAPLSAQVGVALGLWPGGAPGVLLGDGGAATQALVCSPMGIGFDAAGRLHIADTTANRIRMVDAEGIIHTVAGTGQTSSGGDGGPASAAGLYAPAGFTFSSDGALFIAQTGGSRIRRVEAGYGAAPSVVDGVGLPSTRGTP